MDQTFFENKINLRDQLAIIDSLFDTNKILQENLDQTKIQKYYSDSNLGYRLVHSKGGSVHMAINYDGVFHTDGYFQQTKEISLQLLTEGQQILELGCGMGFNSNYLAENFPKNTFTGIDITQKHLLQANKKAAKRNNMHVRFGDFHEIPFPPLSFDFVFELESICHSDQPNQVLSEVYRVLKPGGKFMLFEGFRVNQFDHFTDEQKRAAALIEKTMGVNFGHNIEEWLIMAKNIGFEVQTNDNISEAILPNLIRFHRLANTYFRYPWLAKLGLKLMSLNLLKNTIAGSLMPFSIAQGMQTYQRIILVKSI